MIWSIRSGSAHPSGMGRHTTTSIRSAGIPRLLSRRRCLATIGSRKISWRRTCIRPASIRETSSKSETSLVTRSASASMVSMMSRFCSSVNRSQRRSKVEEKPLTEVSGERNSCASVDSSAAWSRSARWRATAPRRATTTRSTGSLGAERR